MGARNDTSMPARVCVVGPKAHRDARWATILEAIDSQVCFEPSDDDQRRAKLVLVDAEPFDAAALQAVQALRTKNPFVCIVAISSGVDADHFERLIAAGADDVLDFAHDEGLFFARMKQVFAKSSPRPPAKDDGSCDVASALQRDMAFVHDLRNPLAVVQANLDYLRSTADGDLRELKDAFDDTREACARMEAMLSDYAALLRLVHEPDVLETTPIALDAIVEAVTLQIARGAARKNLRVESEIRPATVRGDVALVQRAAACVAEAAVRLSPRDGVVAIVLRDGPMAEFGVGVGAVAIAETDRRNVFSTGRVARRAQRALGGVGMGFELCRRVADVHGGHVEVTSTDRWPTYFLLRLPRLGDDIARDPRMNPKADDVLASLAPPR